MTENGADLDVKEKADKNFSFKLKAGVFLASVGGLSAVAGFGTALAAARRKEAEVSARAAAGAGAGAGAALATGVPADAALLALRALAWGSAYAVGGVGLLCFGVWKLSGAKDLKEFRTAVGSVLPRIPKKDSSGRTEFEGLSDLLNYIISESENKKSKE